MNLWLKIQNAPYEGSQGAYRLFLLYKGEQGQPQAASFPNIMLPLSAGGALDLIVNIFQLVRKIPNEQGEANQ